MPLVLYFYFFPAGVRSTAISMSVCPSVRLSACISQKPHIQNLPFLNTCYLWPCSIFLWWQYNTLYTSVLWMSCFHKMKWIGQNQIQCICFIQFSRWQHRGKVCRFWLRLVEIVSHCQRLAFDFFVMKFVWVIYWRHKCQQITVTSSGFCKPPTLCLLTFPESLLGLLGSVCKMLDWDFLHTECRMCYHEKCAYVHGLNVRLVIIIKLF